MKRKKHKMSNLNGNQQIPEIQYPVNQINIASIRFTDNPLDEFQKLYFNQIWNGNQSLDLDVKEQLYKSSNTGLTVKPNVIPKSKRKTSTDKKIEILKCFEYEVPKLKSCNDESTPSTPIFNGPTERKTYKPSNVSNDRDLNRNSAQCILWEYRSGYVFFTGIWKTYQDVIAGKMGFPQYNDNQVNRLIHDTFKLELEYVTSNSTIEYGKHKTHIGEGMLSGVKRRKVAISPQNSRSVTNTNYNYDDSGFIKTLDYSKYKDFQWNKVPLDLRNSILQSFKNHLVSELGNKWEDVKDVTLDDFTKRVRGGYIKIQGTWLPMQIARMLCNWFCFPIRYLLVPIFGPKFPEDCENCYNEYHRPINLTTNRIQSPVTFVNRPVASSINNHTGHQRNMHNTDNKLFCIDNSLISFNSSNNNSQMKFIDNNSQMKFIDINSRQMFSTEAFQPIQQYVEINNSTSQRQRGINDTDFSNRLPPLKYVLNSKKESVSHNMYPVQNYERRSISNIMVPFPVNHQALPSFINNMEVPIVSNRLPYGCLIDTEIVPSSTNVRRAVSANGFQNYSQNPNNGENIQQSIIPQMHAPVYIQGNLAYPVVYMPASQIPTPNIRNNERPRSRGEAALPVKFNGNANNPP
ncbi:Xbp1p NDAI_0B03610 [Naumovozyma dairenensis CBS 421]|uniref:HTH APSES-type domain-containing protein n=1 Tax=Naumovozyma dairenensis (strain ATCC 10597 / BCRC 20456 / CBS 421 / NBRC 0211 / NRRL Y-12639) TaxID=1071378 RepID=G0W6I4_NAUDC|nr:hypothetical protein NDAI_0B03610 [Naumovozyma dairenensis CBS 421]CCD23395.1 hypothetical protein NDAI_0B03610 [Naumovozyma dairenensis CBS 421]